MSEPCILIVDDSRLARQVIRKIVAAHYPEWTIVEAADYEEALANAEGSLPDLATIDYNMPGKNGLELIESFQEGYPDLRAILLTANIQDAVREKAEELGVLFVEKPIEEDRLLAAIRKVEETRCA